MAHQQQFDFVKKVKSLYPNHFWLKKVVEFGSLNLNGTVRDFFKDCDYTGVDIVEGDGVDRVDYCHKFYEDSDYDVVISCEMLEHDLFYHASLTRMANLVKPGGLLIITCATEGRPEHGTTNHSPADSPATNNYYRNIVVKDIMIAYRELVLNGYFDTFHVELNHESHDLYIYAKRAL